MNTNLSINSIIKRNADIVTSTIDGEIVMMSIDNGEYYGLDEIASRIWELIEQPISVENLVTLLMEEFEVDKTDCTNDTMGFLNEMAAKNLLSVMS